MSTAGAPALAGIHHPAAGHRPARSLEVIAAAWAPGPGRFVEQGTLMGVGLAHPAEGLTSACGST
jgi:hypothetical protein